MITEAEGAVDVRSDLPPDVVERDVEAILASLKLQQIKRFFRQRFWRVETMEAEFAAKVETPPRLESVADHSWHVADTALLLSGHFPYLDVGRCVMLAVIHDKLEIFTGDKNPVGRDGTGSSTHAFNVAARMRKSLEERQA